MGISDSVSVIVPAFNAQRTIGTAIQSVLAGTFHNFEIIVCDDASTDQTRSIIEQFTDPRVRLAYNQHTMGPGASRNRAISMAQGDWIALLDADDAYLPNRLASLMQVAAEHADCIVFDEIMECHDTVNGLVPWRPVRHPRAFPGLSNEIRPVRIADWIRQRRPVIAPLIPVSAFRPYGVKYSDKPCSEDLEFLLRVLAHSRAGLWYVPKSMYLYRITPGSLSTNSDRYSLTATTLRNISPLFAGDAETVDALRSAEEHFLRSGEYREFLNQLRKGRTLEAFGTMSRNRWMLTELLRRSVRQFPYLISRILHRGRPKRR